MPTSHDANPRPRSIRPDARPRASRPSFGAAPEAHEAPPAVHSAPAAPAPAAKVLSVLAPAALALSALFLGALVSAAPARAADAPPPHPDKIEYQGHPFTVAGGTIPQVLLVLSKDLRMFQQGYPALVDLDGDGRVDTGFNPGVEYVGYFDSRSCYTYVGSVYTGLESSVFAVGDTNGYFKRAGPTIDDQTEAQIAAGRPASLKSYVPSPRSPFGVCRNPSTNTNAAGRFSGNWLNFIATSRIDAARKILYGGKRKIDTTTRTVLEPSLVPSDSTTWGTEIRSDDTWMEVTPLSAYHDITKYTPFAKPANGTAHFVARGSDLGRSNRYFGALRVLKNANYQSFNIGSRDSVNELVVATAPRGRYWDWVLVNRPLPDDRVLKPALRSAVEVYNLSVEVCAKDNIGPYEGCLSFPNTSADASDDIWKPGGLLQRYGRGSAQMHFGLLTGHYGDNYTHGGMLRNHVGPVMGSRPVNSAAYTPPIDAATGQVLAGGLIKNIDNLTIAGRPVNRSPVGDGQFYANHKSWANPVGEMLFEAVRYLGGAESPTGTYAQHADSDSGDSSINSLTSFRGNGSWKNGRPAAEAFDCVKPVILLISDIFNDRDGDHVGAWNNTGIELNRPLLPAVSFPPGYSTSDFPQEFGWKKYLDTITRIEGYASSGARYIYSRWAATPYSCQPRALDSLQQVWGICPQGPATGGGYSAVASAYYAHIHDFNLSTGDKGVPTGIDVYSVAMNSAFPELYFPVRDSSGKVVKSATIVPTNISALVDGGSTFMGFLNYFVLEWDADKNGQTFHAKIKVNFSDQSQGDDWEGDGQITYEIDLLTDASTPASMRSSTRVDVMAGELRGNAYYVFKNPADADSRDGFIDIQPSQVKAIRVASSWQTTGTGAGMAMGYTISGTTHDGPYLDLTMNSPPASPYLTPKDCHFVGGSTSGTYGCGKRITSLSSMSRVFEFSNAGDVGTLPSALWLAAKYGGFKDYDNDGVPDPGEWEGTDGNPWNYFGTTKLSELSDQLEGAFMAIARSITTGTATSASINSVMGGGVSVHTAYYPTYSDPDDNSDRIDWAGTVYGLFVDKWGNVREDYDGDGLLTLSNRDADTIVSDTVVSFTSIANPPKSGEEPDCYQPGAAITRCVDRFGDGANLVPLVSSEGRPASIHRLKPIWDAGRWLAELDTLDDTPALLSGSRPWGSGYSATMSRGQRRIYFTDPAESGDLKLFNTTPASLATLTKYLVHDNWASTLPHPITTPPTPGDRAGVTTRLVEYVQGAEIEGWRSREVANPWGAPPQRVVWRLGDVINSKPVVVGPPSFNYDTLYGSVSYSAYRQSAGARRQVVYVGANDGMLHAFNGGFYGSLASGQVGYSKTPFVDPGVTAASHELGAEIWAYIPASILPHLKWLADPAYGHAWMVDMKPLMADVVIDGKWRTILIGGLRLGGRPIEGVPATPGGANPEPWYSEIFCLDVTDPEAEPKFLWRFSSLELGLSVGMPAVVRSGNDFYVVLASGPKTDSVDMATNSIVYGANSPYDGHSDQRARLFVLKAGTGEQVDTGERLMVPAAHGNSFFNEPFVPLAGMVDRSNGLWTNHVVYYGLTISRDPASCEDSGAVYRLRMVGEDDGKYTTLPPQQWTLAPLISTGRPVTGAVNSTYDKSGNLWVVFATGRMWSVDDLAPCSAAPAGKAASCAENHQQYLYGVKEPLGEGGIMTFADLTSRAPQLVDVSHLMVGSDAKVTADGETDPSSAQSYADLAASIMDPAVPGFKRLLNMGSILRPHEPHNFEINFAQPKILSLGNGQSLVAFTTFEPKSVNAYCGELGRSYMYILDTFTGLPGPALAAVFASADPDLTITGANRITGGVDTGTEIDTEATITVGEGVVIIGTESADNSRWEKRIPVEAGGVSGVVAWREAINTGFTMDEESMTMGIDPAAAP